MDVDEMDLPGHNVVKLFERRAYGLGVKEITKHDLIAQALRIGVDYVIVNGKILMRDRTVKGEEEIIKQAVKRIKKLAGSVCGEGTAPI